MKAEIKEPNVLKNISDVERVFMIEKQVCNAKKEPSVFQIGSLFVQSFLNFYGMRRLWLKLKLELPSV